jgi:glycine dehydrogenase subunit 1
MTFNPHTGQDRIEMLDVVGAPSISTLFAPIPEHVRFPTLQLPAALTEMEADRLLSGLASENIAVAAENNYLGAGSYRHYVPSAVGQILARGEFYTAYTPYQPEVAQGTLQVIYEFQSMVAALTGMDIANASMYDGATALAEGALMTVSQPRGRTRIVVAGTVHPAYYQVLRTYVSGIDVQLVALPAPTSGFMTGVNDLAPFLSDDLACVVVQYPNFFGGIEDLQAIADLVHARGSALVVSTYPAALGLLKPPGELGADVVAAEGQSLGVAQSFGGPYVGLLAARQSYVRQMPGRLAGLTTDTEGKRGFVLTLQTREQHIRREKATSNICTNQGLLATAATVHMATLGPEGLKEAALRSCQNAHYLAGCVSAVPGYAMLLSGPYFNEFVVSTPVPAAEVTSRLLGAGILAGLDLGAINPALKNALLLCATELNTRAGIDRLVGLLPR